MYKFIKNLHTQEKNWKNRLTFAVLSQAAEYGGFAGFEQNLKKYFVKGKL
jgi:hypothetical protein